MIEEFFNVRMTDSDYQYVVKLLKWRKECLEKSIPFVGCLTDPKIINELTQVNNTLDRLG